MDQLILKLPNFNLSLIIFQLIVAFGLFGFVNILGYFSKEQGYESLSELTDERWGKFNTAFRILTPPIYLALISIVLYEVKRPLYINHIWLVTLWYTIFQVMAYKITRRWEFKDKRIFFLIQISSTILSYIFYKSSLIKGLGSILPDGSFRNEVWLLVIAYLFTLFTSSYSPFSYNKYKMVHNTITKRYDDFFSKFYKELTPAFKKDKVLRTTLFSIMIIEDMNRPKLFRMVERLLFKTGLVTTTGIMQVSNDKYLSDKASIEEAQKIITQLFAVYNEANQKYPLDPFSLVRDIAFNYNPDYRYVDSVQGIFSRLYYYERNKP